MEAAIVTIDTKKDAAILMGFFDYISNPLDIFIKLKEDTNKFILASFPKSGGILAFQRKIRYNMRNCQLFYYSENLSIKWFIFVILISTVSQLGDIFISYFKRLSKIKDTGKIIPGHGGLLDRIDGMIFAFPFMYILIKIL